MRIDFNLKTVEGIPSLIEKYVNYLNNERLSYKLNCIFNRSFSNVKFLKNNDLTKNYILYNILEILKLKMLTGEKYEC